jgi:hypothetical protein
MWVHQFVTFTHKIRGVCTHAILSPNHMALFNAPLDRSAHTTIQHRPQHKMDCGVRTTYSQSSRLTNTTTLISVTCYRVAADPDGRTVYGVGLRPLTCWHCGFESRRKYGCLSLAYVPVMSGRGICDGPIPRPKENYRVCIFPGV